MAHFNSKYQLALLLAFNASVFGCDDFTCEDYATCELPDSGKVLDNGGSFVDIDGSVGSGNSTNPNWSTMNDHDAGSRITEDSDQPDGTSEGSSSFKAGVNSDVADGAAPRQDADVSDASEPDGRTSGTHEEMTLAEVTDASTNNGPDAGDSNGDSATSSTDTPNCDPETPFGRPFPIAAINLDNEVENVMVTPDGLAAYVQYGTEPTMYVSKREKIFEDFGTPQPYVAFDDVLAQDSELHVRSITKDGLTVYLSSDVWGSPVQSAHRRSTRDVFSQLIVHEELSAFQMPISDPWITPDGSRIYGFMPAAYTLWEAERSEAGFSSLTEIVAADSESAFEGMNDFTLSTSELVLYVVTNSFDDEFFENGAIVRAERASRNDPFANWVVMGSVGTAYVVPLWVSDDDCEIMLRQTHESGEEDSVSSDMFLARRSI